MKKKLNKYLIIGGAGFIGFHLSKRISENTNNHILIIDNFSRGSLDSDFKKLIKKKNVKILKKDILKISLNKIPKNFDYVINLAAIVGVRNVLKNPYKVLILNFEINKLAIQIAKNQNKIKKFIFMSTSEIYAGSLENNLLKFPSKESNVISLQKFDNPRSVYMMSKIYGEIMCQNSNVPFLILRPHNFFGPRMGMDHVIPEMIYKFISSKKNILIKNSNHLRTFCYIDDAVDIIEKLINKRVYNQTLNIGQSNPVISIGNLAKSVAKVVNADTRRINLDFKKKDFSPTRRQPSVFKLKTILKKIPKTNLKLSIKKTYNWYLKNI